MKRVSSFERVSARLRRTLSFEKAKPAPAAKPASTPSELTLLMQADDAATKFVREVPAGEVPANEAAGETTTDAEAKGRLRDEGVL